MKTSEKHFHLAKNGQELGVFREHEIKRAYSEGQIDGDVLIWGEGMEGWVTIFDVFPQWKPTEAQIRFLADCRIEVSGSLTRNEASRLLEKRPPSNYELLVLQKMGVRGIPQMTGEEAKTRIEEFSEQKPEKFDKIRDEVRAEEAKQNYERMIKNMPVALKNELLENEDEKTEISPENRREMNKAEREVENGRAVFWETTLLAEPPRINDEVEEWISFQEIDLGMGQVSPPSSFPSAVAFKTPSSRKLYSDYGHRFRKPQKVQISKVLKALDGVDMRWEEKDLSLFYQTLESWFPELKK